MCTCKKCGGETKDSKALLNQWVAAVDFPGQTDMRGCTMSRRGKAKLHDVKKCTSCGHSFIPKTGENAKEAIFASSEDYMTMHDAEFQGQTRIDEEGKYKMYWLYKGLWYYTVQTMYNG